MNLYDLTNEYMNIINMTNDDDLDEQYIKDTLEMYDDEIHDRVNHYSRVIAQLDDDCDVLEKRINEMETKLKRKKNIIKYCKEAILYGMKMFEINEIKTDLFNVKIANNGGKNPIEIDEQNVPIDYMVQKYEINKEKIREDLEKGKELPFARVLERGQHISIK